MILGCKNILITLFFADGLHGGVKYTMELGEFFIKKGYNVYVCGVKTEDNICKLFNSKGIFYYNVNDFPLENAFDIVWAHHFPIVPYLIRKGLKYNRLINSCISNILLIERFMWFYENIDLCLTLTQKTKDMFVNNYSVPESKIMVLPNTAPDEFFNYDFKRPTKLRNIAVVSNHPPKELRQAIKSLRRHGIKTIYYGGKKSVNVTPELLSNFDCIISIGKTVQYALAMGVPVYNYDHFGGNGYITTANIEEEERANFSGRSTFTKKNSTQIMLEIVAGYDEVLRQQQHLKQFAVERYLLSKRINNVMQWLNAQASVSHIIENNTNRIFFDYCQYIIETSYSHKKSKRKFIHRLMGIKE